jgi:hypothetical protein
VTPDEAGAVVAQSAPPAAPAVAPTTLRHVEVILVVIAVQLAVHMQGGAALPDAARQVLDLLGVAAPLGYGSARILGAF